MKHLDHSITAKEKRALRVRATIVGTAERPRVVISRSNKYVWLQALDDIDGKVVAVASDKALRLKKDAGTKTASAAAAGTALAEKLQAQKITKAVFDRGYYKYHGRVAAVADALRNAGIQV